MKKKCVLFVFLGMLFSCIENSGYVVPDINCSESNLIQTHSIQQVKEMVGFGLREFNENMVISGFVVSSDETGNFYKSLYIQDAVENANSAIKIELDLADYYTKYPLGRKVFVQLQGLSISYVRGTIAIGKAIGGGLERIPNLSIKNHIFRSCDSENILAKKIDISSLKEAHVGMLLQFDNMQFKAYSAERTYANPEDTKSVELILEQFSENCTSIGTINLQTSGFSKFKSEKVSDKNGSITAILEKYYNSYHLRINEVSNLNFSENRCENNQSTKATISIKDLNDMYKGKIVEFGVGEVLIIEGYVISTDEEKNFENIIVIQDAIENPKDGVRLLIEKENHFESFSFGEKLFIKLNKLYLDKVDGKLTIGVFKDDSVDEIEENEIAEYIMQTDSIFPMVPKQLLLHELSENVNSMMLATVKNVQLSQSDLGKAFAYYSGQESANRTVESCGELEKVAVLTSGTSLFANKKFPGGNGSISGVLSNNTLGFELQMNYEKDVSFFDVYEECAVITPQILITEIADPENSVSSRFVELYNAGDTAIKLTGWKLNKYINGATTVSSNGLVLQGVVEPKEFYIIANFGFKEAFGLQANIESNYISGNGDDVYELLDETEKRQDVFGVIGEDGTGKNWEYTDGRAERNKNRTTPNKTFDFNEWNIDSKSNSDVKNAPKDFNPKKW